MGPWRGSRAARRGMTKASGTPITMRDGEQQPGGAGGDPRVPEDLRHPAHGDVRGGGLEPEEHGQRPGGTAPGDPQRAALLPGADARGRRPRLRRSAPGGAGRRRSRTSGSQGSTAAAARTAQTARPAANCRPAPSVIGTVTAAASAVPRARAME